MHEDHLLSLYPAGRAINEDLVPARGKRSIAVFMCGQRGPPATRGIRKTPAYAIRPRNDIGRQHPRGFRGRSLDRTRGRGKGTQIVLPLRDAAVILVAYQELLECRVIVGEPGAIGASPDTPRIGLGDGQTQLIPGFDREIGCIQLQRQIAAPGRNHFVLVFTRIGQGCQPDLFQVAQASDTLGFFLGPAQCGQEHGCENSDNGNDHQQFN